MGIMPALHNSESNPKENSRFLAPLTPGTFSSTDLGHCTETAFLIDMITNLVRENPCPHQEKSNRGRPPVHSRAKLDFICILMVAWHKTSRDMESDLSVIKIPWVGEPVPDHTTLARHLQTISQDWLDTILTKTATLCVAEAGSATGPLGADSSGVETTRYETVTRPLKSEKNFVEMARKAYLKYHVIAILGLQIILRPDPLLFPKPVRPTFQAGFRQAACSASHSSL